MGKIKSIINTFSYITTCVIIGTAIYIKVFWQNTQLTVDILWQILSVSLLCSLGNVLYFDNHKELDEKSLKKRFLIRIIVHYLYINCIVIGFGLIYEWFYLDRIDMMVSIFIMILFIFILIWFTNFLRDKELAEQLNEKLKEYYKKE
ncbi:DUF3021 family protein [Candidatus Galacturonibacter soehngenii]|uniref:DUF3021 family protein n=1 Tax=Candidatus Galacturonatibacter soehngenii TaxID=2307010 RepID=UPI001783ED3E|nr:DUF3021 family protein [Candidatus Galacturonibacter soehngenii]MBA4687822.1 DUF3021 family protein [Candidatus Galacturonibacter soehngenii]